MAYALQPASAKFILDFFPEFLIDNRLMLSLVEFIIMLDFPNVKRIRKKPVDFIPRPAVRLVMSSCIDGGPVLGFDAEGIQLHNEFVDRTEEQILFEDQPDGFSLIRTDFQLFRHGVSLLAENN